MRRDNIRRIASQKDEEENNAGRQSSDRYFQRSSPGVSVNNISLLFIFVMAKQKKNSELAENDRKFKIQIQGEETENRFT